jgi:folate-binding protein YgfZ
MESLHLPPLHLNDRAVIALAGGEARGFLQNLVSNDVSRLEPGRGLYAALLSPQGKVAFDFFLIEGDGALLLDVAADARDALLKKLKLYRLRARVEIEPRDQLGVYAALAGHPAGRPTPYADRAISFADPRDAGLPARSIGAVAEMPAGLPGPGAYHEARLALGVPEGGDFGFEKLFALDAGLDELHAIDFDKGCYVGQELTARMKHRATSRKRPVLLAAQTPLPSSGTILTLNDVEIGEIIAVYDRRGFASVRLDKLGDATEVLAGDLAITLTRPAWLG